MGSGRIAGPLGVGASRGRRAKGSRGPPAPARARLSPRLWTLGFPTTVISMRPLWHFVPTWATVWQQVAYDKIQECELLERAGVLVPAWRPLYKDREADLSGLGEYVVVKDRSGVCAHWTMADKLSGWDHFWGTDLRVADHGRQGPESYSV